MKKTLIFFLLFAAFQSKAQFTTLPTLKNTDPLSKISKVQFDSVSKVVTIFTKSDSWDFVPITAYPTKSGYEVTAKSGCEKLYFVFRLKGRDINFLAAYDAESLEKVWSFE